MVDMPTTRLLPANTSWAKPAFENTDMPRWTARCWVFKVEPTIRALVVETMPPIFMAPLVDRRPKRSTELLILTPNPTVLVTARVLTMVEPDRFRFFVVKVFPTSRLQATAMEDMVLTFPWIWRLEKKAAGPSVEAEPCNRVAPATVRLAPTAIEDRVERLEPNKPFFDTNRESPTTTVEAVERISVIFTLPPRRVDPRTFKEPPAIKEDMVEILYWEVTELTTRSCKSTVLSSN